MEQQHIVEKSEEFQKLSFQGKEEEYFNIWIINILLTIVTLGVYSAWAKVRRKRYFYGKTILSGSSFDYHAKGMQIFLGRTLIFIGVLVYLILAYINPIYSLIFSAPVLCLVPWLIAHGLRFNARVTSYRNIPV